LINEVLDGVASPEDRERLDRILTSDPQAREAYERLSLVFRALEQVRSEAAPAELHRNILLALEKEPAPEGRAQREAAESAPPSTAPRPVGGLWSEMAGALAARPVPALVLAFVVGALIGVIGYMGFVGGLPGGGEDSLGAIGMAPEAGTPRGTPSVIDQARLSTGDVTVIAESRVADDGIQVVLDADAVEDAAIELTYDASRFEVATLHWSRPEHGAVSCEPGRISIEHRGIVRYLLHLEGLGAGDSQFHVTVRSHRGVAEEVIASDPSGTDHQ
jgi:hypothetical protein